MGCCDDSIVLGTPGSDGTDGISCYVYIGYADLVVAGAPDVVTNYGSTPTVDTEWIAIRTSATPLTPVEADFQGLWFKVKGDAGAGGVNIKVNNSTVTGSPFTTLDFIGAELTGVTGADAGGGEVDLTFVTAGFILRSRAQMLNLISLDQLVPGVTYWIYDVGDGADCSINGDGGIIVRAIATNQISLDGIYVARVPNRIATQLYNSVDTFATGDYVEALNEVYQLIGATTVYTTNPAGDSANWTFIDKSDDTLYNTEIHSCKYDIQYNVITERSDFRGNILKNVAPVTIGGNTFIQQCFRWGVDTYYNNKISVYQDSSGWSVDRLPDFGGWYFDVSNFITLFANNTVEPYCLLGNTAYEKCYTFSGNVLKSTAPSTTLIDLTTGTSGVELVPVITNSDLFDVSLTGCYNLNFDENILRNSALSAVYGTGSSSIFSNNNLIQSIISNIEDCTISSNNGKVSMSHITLSSITNNHFSIDALSGYLSDIYDCAITLNNFNGIFQIGDTDIATFSALVAPNDVFNGYSICGCTIAQNSCTNHIEMSRIRPDLNTNGGTRIDNWIVGCTFSGSFPQGFSNILYTETFKFLYLTFVGEGYISEIDTNTAASYSGTAGAALPANFGKTMIEWRDWIIGVPIVGSLTAGGIGLNKPYNMVTCGSDQGANYYIETSKDTNNPATKEILPTRSNVIGYLDLDDTAVFNAGTLTIPVGMQFCGIYYLYNTNGDNITNIANLVGTTDNTLGITKEFRVLNGTGVTFTPTAKAGATATTMISTGAGPYNLLPITDFIQIKKVGLATGVANSTLEITQISIMI